MILWNNIKAMEKWASGTTQVIKFYKLKASLTINYANQEQSLQTKLVSSRKQQQKKNISSRKNTAETGFLWFRQSFLHEEEHIIIEVEEHNLNFLAHPWGLFLVSRIACTPLFSRITRTLPMAF